MINNSVSIGPGDSTTGGGGFSAVLLPKPNCPALLRLAPTVVPTIDATGANSTTLALTLHAPWRQNTATTAAGALLSAVVNISAPGLTLSASTLTVPATLTLRVAKPTSKPTAAKSNFLLTIQGDGVLPTRRWVTAV